MEVMARRSFTREELDEVFPRPPLREVAFELRFPPRLRVQAEIWRLQDQLVADYPDVGKETAIQPNGTILDVSVFGNPRESRVIKITHQNFLIAFTRYVRFEDFKAEVLSRSEQFCRTFGIDSFLRVGLRYVNEIGLPGTTPGSLLTYVRPVLKFERFPIESIDQFAVEIRSRREHQAVTVRTALIPGVLQTYVLDIDCHTDGATSLDQCRGLLDSFHDGAQQIFLDHITEEYKNLMRKNNG
jgi:uncharacterized protein (TIGR04255 family)